jgi:23S rRNA (uracil1939-C5)-methyltransferase
VRRADASGKVGALFTLRPGATLTRDAERAIAAIPSPCLVHVRGAEALGFPPFQTYASIGATRLRVPLGGFMQVNFAVNALLIEHIVERALRLGLRTFADLYGGSGNFSLPLAARGLRGVCVERDAASIAALISAAAEQRLGIDAMVGDALAETARWADRGTSFDLFVVDAPRAGLKTGHATVAAIASRVIALCSCNPQTFARDAARLCEHGFELRNVTAFDMFPGTWHVEVVGWLRRVEAPRSAEPARAT